LNKILKISEYKSSLSSRQSWNNFPHFPIEPHRLLLNQPEENQNLYKVIPKKYFDDMFKRNYIYFNRVDSYNDDKSDGEQLPLDRVVSEKIYFQKKTYEKGILRPYSVSDYYDNCRSRSYACCMSFELTEYLREEYGGGHPVCLQIEFGKMRSVLNKTIADSTLIYKGQNLPQLFSINYGIPEYVDVKNARQEGSQNPVRQLYMKDKKYECDKELRITLSTTGMGHYQLPTGDFLVFEKGLEFEFNWECAFNEGWLKKVC
jgi:hypothetical protein